MYIKKIYVRNMKITKTKKDQSKIRGQNDL